eukprot:365175-Chlamydomonas_euryale.AAC.7
MDVWTKGACVGSSRGKPCFSCAYVPGSQRHACAQETWTGAPWVAAPGWILSRLACAQLTGLEGPWRMPGAPN